MISPRSLWAACKYLQKVAKGLQKVAKVCKILQKSAKSCKSLQKFQWKILHPLSNPIVSYPILPYPYPGIAQYSVSKHAPLIQEQSRSARGTAPYRSFPRERRGGKNGT